MRIVALGLLTLDVIQRVGTYPAQNEKTVADETILDFGGPAANAAAAAATLGSDTTLISAIDDAPPSILVKDLLSSTRVDFVALSEEQPVPVATVIVSQKSGDRAVVSSYKSLPTYNRLAHGLPPCDVLLLDGHHLSSAIEAATIAKDRGTPIILDGGSWKTGLDELLPMVDVAILSEDFAGPADYVMPCKFVAITHGQDNIEIVAPEKRFISVPQVDAVNTLGAGDVFHGAFAHYIAGWPLTISEVQCALSRAGEVASSFCANPSTRLQLR
ncbi:carbohydrate kinase [Actinomycetaceae bacterium WB03_NA08]|uniref:Carbohydrate kinase n=1 Tax=Scrofimicrobium canadense TaxID=2652290 RepID=A0A6N7VSE6_9ACTO|nr:PfkB family carbohydrate kinase [Scrofimicrobium canadense]MSS83880.1 carbohydrate kinase [Scrofimicrobium canadense]